MLQNHTTDALYVLKNKLHTIATPNATSIMVGPITLPVNLEGQAVNVAIAVISYTNLWN
ncbi:hypothetical protein [Paenibacillus xylanexedens]|uniref:hypothetical protein n=1 Tax=Paenibacillus xylanexedens TaxID=528191 RepID=UPI003D33748A